MKPTTDKLLVRVHPLPEVKEGEEKPKGNQTMIADVLAVGPETKQVKAGDVVGFSPYGFDEVVIKDEKLVVVSEMMILGIYE